MPVPYADPDPTVIFPGERPYLTGVVVEKGRATLPRGAKAGEAVCVTNPASCCGERPLHRPRVSRGCPNGVPGVLTATVVPLVGYGSGGLDMSGITGVPWHLAWDVDQHRWYGEIEVAVEACWQWWRVWLTPITSPHSCYAAHSRLGALPGPESGYWCWTVRLRTNGSATCWDWCGATEAKAMTLPIDLPRDHERGRLEMQSVVWTDVSTPASCDPFELSLPLYDTAWAVAVTE